MLALLAPCGRAAAAVEISIACGALGVELKLCAEAAAGWERETGHRVKIVSTPNSSTDRLALYLQMLASRTDDIDGPGCWAAIWPTSGPTWEKHPTPTSGR
jgi:trehalose/maltose transport system substrate-binding protein